MSTNEPKHYPLAIDELAATVLRLKADEAVAAQLRKSAELALYQLLGKASPKDGSKTFEGAAFKVTVTRGFDRKVTVQGLAEIRGQLDDSTFSRVFDYEPKIVLKELRIVEQYNPEAYAIIARVMTKKEKSPSLKVVPIEPPAVDVAEAELAGGAS